MVFVEPLFHQRLRLIFFPSSVPKRGGCLNKHYYIGDGHLTFDNPFSIGLSLKIYTPTVPTTPKGCYMNGARGALP